MSEHIVPENVNRCCCANTLAYCLIGQDWRGTSESTDLSAESHVEEDHHLLTAEIHRRVASYLCSYIAHVAHMAG